MGKARDLKKKKRGEGVKAKRSKNLKDGGSDSEEDLEQVLKEYIREAKELNEFSLYTSLVERPSPRSGASLIPIGGEKYFFFGGECRSADDTLNYFNDLFVFRLKNQTVEWKRAEGKNGNSGPGPRSAHQMAVAPFHPTQAFLFGGEYGSKRDTKFLQYRDFWILHTTPSLRWERIEFANNNNNSPGPRSGHRMVGWRNYVVLFGGYVDSGRGELKYLNDLWLLDVRTMTWQNPKCPKGNLNWPTPRSGFCFCAVDEFLYLVGGFQSQVLNDAYTLELLAEPSEEVEIKWTKLRNVPNFNRSGMSAVSLGPSALLFGGISDNVVTDDRIHGQCLNDLFEITCQAGIQSMTTLAITGRYNAAMCRINNSSSFLLVSGIVENVDEEIALDDVIVVNCAKREYKANIVQPLSFTLPEPMQLTDSSCSNSSDNDISSNSDDSDDSSDYESDSEKESSEEKVELHPNVRKDQTLREYFQEHLNYWLSINTDLDESEKERRRLAFEACKSHFESLSLK